MLFYVIISCTTHGHQKTLIIKPLDVLFFVTFGPITLAHWWECWPMARDNRVQSHTKSYRRLKKWYLMTPCITLSIIRYGSRIKWSKRINGATPSPIHWCRSYWKGCLRVALNYGRQLSNFFYPSKIMVLFKYVKLMTVDEGDPKPPFSIATILRCRGGATSFLGLLHFTLDLNLIMLSVKQGISKYYFLCLWYDSTWDWT